MLPLNPLDEPVRLRVAVPLFVNVEKPARVGLEVAMDVVSVTDPVPDKLLRFAAAPLCPCTVRLVPALKDTLPMLPVAAWTSKTELAAVTLKLLPDRFPVPRT